MDVDAVFAALADPTRRAVIGRLAQEPASASRLAGELPVSRQAVAKHLAARGPRAQLRAQPGADGRGDGVDGVGRRALGRAAGAARAARSPTGLTGRGTIGLVPPAARVGDMTT